MKLSPTVEEIAEMSPMCSTIVAREIGTIVMIAVIRRLVSRLPLVKILNTVSLYWKGQPIHAAFLMFSMLATEKSWKLALPPMV